jgi:hypothetical protein
MRRGQARQGGMRKYRLRYLLPRSARAKPPATTTNTVAIVSLIISLFSASFALFNWWNSERQARISAAVDYSLKYINDSAAASDRLIYFDVLGRPKEMKTFVSQPGTKEEHDENISARHLQRLEYLAFLLTHNKMDVSYISNPLICELIAASEIMKHDPPKWMNQYFAEWVDIRMINLAYSYYSKVQSCSPTPTDDVLFKKSGP